jgi:DNA-3-methyladenine glycosylase II
MFLMFHLRRPDVLPVGDLGIRRAVERAYGLSGLPDEDDLQTLAAPWRPQRTLLLGLDYNLYRLKPCSV